MTGGPLLRVMELSSGWTSAAVCGRLLAEVGAEVVRTRVEPTSAAPRPPIDDLPDGVRTLHRLKSDQTLGLSALRELLGGRGSHDVVVLDDPWRRWLEATGIPTTEIDAPVVAHLTPWGLTHADRLGVGNELTTQAVSGLLAVTGHPDGPPTRAGVALGAGAAGLNGATAVLAALRRWRRAGTSTVLDLADVDTLAMMQGNFLPRLFTTGEAPPRVGNVQLLSAPWNAYPTRDGEVVIVAISERLWQRLLATMERPDLAERQDLVGKSQRVDHRDEVDDAIRAWTRQHTSAEVVSALLDAGVPVSDVASIATVLDAPFTRERAVVEIEDGRPVLGRLLGRTRPTTQGPAEAPSREGSVADRRPLDGIRVLELGGHTAGGMATRLLADLGADVIKVELPQGDNARTTVPVLEDGDAYLWHFWNVGKRSVVLDFTTDHGHDVLRALVGRADVVVQNMAPDTADRLGIGPDDLVPVRPGLIHASISGFGYEGSQRRRRGFDAVLQAAGGIMAVTGDDDRGPVKTGPSVVDNTTAMAAATSVVAAVLERDATGHGAVIDLGLYDVAVWLTAELWPVAWAGGSPGPHGTEHPLHPLDGVHTTADGQQLAVGDPGAAARAEVLTALGLDDVEQMTAWVTERSMATALAEARKAGLPVGEVRDLATFAAADVTRDRQMLDTLALRPEGTCRVLGSPFRVVGLGQLRSEPRTVPVLGEHTDDVLSREVGLDDETLHDLREAGITRSHRELAHD